MFAHRPLHAARQTALALTACVLGACANESATEPPLAALPPSLIGTYSGEFPCGNCAAIEAGLWLRPDGRYVFRQRYADAADALAESSAYSLGTWRWDPGAALLVLEGAGPERRLKHLEPDRLTLETHSPVAHVLLRDAASAPFAESMPMAGIATVSGASTTFRECLSQLELEVSPEGAFAELRRQHRVFSPRGRPALTSVAGYPRSSGAREVWVLDRVLAVKPNGSCSAP